MKLKPSSMMSLTANLLGNKTNLSSKIKPNKFSEENSIMKREKRFANCNCKEKDKYDELLFIESLYKTPPPNSSSSDALHLLQIALVVRCNSSPCAYSPGVLTV